MLISEDCMFSSFIFFSKIFIPAFEEASLLSPFLSIILFISKGTMLGKIVVTDVQSESPIDFFDPNLLNLVSLVSTAEPKCFNESAKDQLHIIAVDCGIKYNQVGNLLEICDSGALRGCRSMIVNHSFPMLLRD